MSDNITLHVNEKDAQALLDLVETAVKHQGQGGLLHIKHLVYLHDKLTLQVKHE